jgi:hypothetical protein
LSVISGLGQAFVDHVCDRAAMPRTKYIGTIDHPTGDRGNHPDLLIRCSDCDLLFEHKLDSPLGPEQLYRYLVLAESKGWKVGLLAAGCHAVDDIVCQSPLSSERKPTNASRHAPVRWSGRIVRRKRNVTIRQSPQVKCQSPQKS